MRSVIMKTVSLLLLPIIIFSCKKDNDKSQPAEEGYYVKLKIDGTWVTWKVVAGELGEDLADPTKTDFGVTANDDAMKDVFDISIQVDGGTVVAGDYASDNPDYWATVSYAKDIGTANAEYFDIEDAPSSPASKYIVHIQSINDTELKGSFTGNYLFNFSSGTTKNITEGEFFVQRLR
jgi:hypothetical protein